jgi:hypothetical protein
MVDRCEALPGRFPQLRAKVCSVVLEKATRSGLSRMLLASQVVGETTSANCCLSLLERSMTIKNATFDAALAPARYDGFRNTVAVQAQVLKKPQHAAYSRLLIPTETDICQRLRRNTQLVLRRRQRVRRPKAEAPRVPAQVVKCFSMSA